VPVFDPKRARPVKKKTDSLDVTPPPEPAVESEEQEKAPPVENTEGAAITSKLLSSCVVHSID
jgi:hypothetical protein